MPGPGPKRKKKSRPPQRSRVAARRQGKLGITRRVLLAGSAGVLAAGFGVGSLLRDRTEPLIQEASAPITGPAPVVAAAAPVPHVDPLMEETPLPSDVYVSRTLMPGVSAVPPPAVTPAAPLVPPPPRRPSVIAGGPAWQRNARPLVAAGGIPAVAIVIDDLGLDRERTERSLRLGRDVTMAFMTYADGLPQWLGQARSGRHEILVHVPMQPEAASVDPGPNALTVGLSEGEILARLRWGLDRMDGYVGANNHMGSRFTEDAAGMRVVLEELQARGMLFLDSRTTGHSACAAVAATVGLPFASRNVFLDNDTSVSAVRAQIMVLEQVARKHGTAIGIGHPHDGTLTALAEWLPLAASRGIAVVPLTSAMRLAAERA
jgi:polysaccharide deacetylase 2 family uncharacterized protein YibQ